MDERILTLDEVAATFNGSVWVHEDPAITNLLLTEAQTMERNAANLPPPPDPYATDNAPDPVASTTDLGRLHRGLAGADLDVHEWLAEEEDEYDWLIEVNLPGFHAGWLV
jgi:hypothetical protein